MKQPRVIIFFVFLLMSSNVVIADGCLGPLCGRFTLNKISQPDLYVEVFHGGDPDVIKSESEDPKRTAKQRAESLQYLTEQTGKLYPGQSTTDLGIADADYIRFPTRQTHSTAGCYFLSAVPTRFGGDTKKLKSDEWHKYQNSLSVYSFHVVCEATKKMGKIAGK